VRRADRDPNWNKLLHMPDLMPWQLAALSLNIDPDKTKYGYSWKAEGKVSDESQEFTDRLEILIANLGRTLEIAAVSYYDSGESKVALRKVLSKGGNRSG
jgi:hypothetical protein